MDTEFFSLESKREQRFCIGERVGRSRIMLYAKGLCSCGKIWRANPKARLLATRLIQRSAKKVGLRLREFSGMLVLKW